MTIWWRGPLTLQGLESDDHRLLEVVDWRDLPLTLRVQTEDFGLHQGASPVGSIRHLEHIEGGPDGSTMVWGRGPFSDSESGQLAAQWVDEGVLRGVSVDPGALEYLEELVDPATGEVVPTEALYEVWDEIEAANILDDDEEEARLYEWVASLYYRVRFTRYQIAAATLLAVPAFGGAWIEIDPENGAGLEGGGEPDEGATGTQQAASAGRLLDGAARRRPANTAQLLAALGVKRSPLASLARPAGISDDGKLAAFSPGRMVASTTVERFDPAADVAGGDQQTEPDEHRARRASVAYILDRPDERPNLLYGPGGVLDLDQVRQARAAITAMRADYYLPEELTARLPWTIEDDGRMHGHLFGWNDCHRSFAGRCERPDRQQDFSDFHTGTTVLDDGTRIRTGVLTFADLHAPGGNLTPGQLQQLMEDTGTQLGTLRLYADEIGVQGVGQVFDDVPATQLARALAGFPSGDWRKVAGTWSLFGLHVVNTPGYPAYEEEDGIPIRMVASMAPFVRGEDRSALLAALGASPCGCGGGGSTPCGCGGTTGLSPKALADLAHLDMAAATWDRSTLQAPTAKPEAMAGKLAALLARDA